MYNKMRNTSSFIRVFYKKSFQFLTMYTVANLQNSYEKLRIGRFQYSNGSSVNVAFANFSISPIRNVAVIRLLEKKICIANCYLLKINHINVNFRD